MAGDVVGHPVRDLAPLAAGEGVVEPTPLLPGERDEVLGGVDGVSSDQFGVGGRRRVCEVDRVVVAHHVPTGRLRDHHLLAAAHLVGEHGDVARGGAGEGLHVPGVQPRGPTALGSLGDRAVDAVALVDLDQVLTDRRLHVLDEAGREDRHRALGRSGGAGVGALTPAPPEPGGEALTGVRRKEPIRCDADRLFHHPARERPTAPGHRVDEGRRGGRHPAHQIGAPEELIGRPLGQRAPLRVPDRVGPHHEPREVELPLVGRHIWTLQVTELALVALVDHTVLFDRGHRRHVAFVRVDEVEQRRERRAQVEAQSAALAQIEDATELAPQIPLVEVPRVGGVVGGGHASGKCRAPGRSPSPTGLVQSGRYSVRRPTPGLR